MGLRHYKGYDNYRRHWLYQVIREVAISRGWGLCELCATRDVTEVHHDKYPVWGAFDTPSNLVAICHECHCEIHNKEN